MSDNKDRVYAPGMNWTAPKAEAPDFIKAKVGIKLFEEDGKEGELHQIPEEQRQGIRMDKLRDEGEPRRTLLLRARYMGAEGKGGISVLINHPYSIRRGEREATASLFFSHVGMSIWVGPI
jgi:hypothetical protein